MKCKYVGERQEIKLKSCHITNILRVKVKNFYLILEAREYGDDVIRVV